MTKRTWTRRTVPDDAIRKALRTAGSVSGAARTLGVNRSTLHRWLQADTSLQEPVRERDAAVQRATDAARNMDPKAWARAIEAAYVLTDTECVLLDLACRALELTRDAAAKPSEQLAAMARFQALVKDLDLEAPQHGKTQNRQLYAVK
ncbi:MAG: helix-turn-helix domain-containing protein [Woeseia sp.]